MRLRELAFLFLRLGHGRVRRPGGAHRDDGGRGRPAARLADARASSSTCSARPTSSPGRTRPSWRSTSATPRRAGPGCSSPARASSCRRRCIVAAHRLGVRAVRHAAAGRGVLYGVKPVIIARRRSRRCGARRAAALQDAACSRPSPLAALAATLLGVNELVVLCRRRRRCAVVWQRGRPAPPLPAARRRSRWSPLLGAAAATAARRRSGSGRCSWSSSRSARCCSAAATSCWRSCAPISSSGCDWLTEAQLLDAVAVGPGHAGPGLHDGDLHRLPARRARRGALVATVGHLPAGVRLRRAERPARAAPARARRRRGAFLDGVNVASLALMAAVTSSWPARRSSTCRPRRSRRRRAAPSAGSRDQFGLAGPRRRPCRPHRAVRAAAASLISPAAALTPRSGSSGTPGRTRA